MFSFIRKCFYRCIGYVPDHLPSGPRKVHIGTRCPCLDGSYQDLQDNCIHPGTVNVEAIDISRFRDEPRNCVIQADCKHRIYCGPSIYRLRSMTEAEYYEFLAFYTKCFHPQEYRVEYHDRCRLYPIGGEFETTDVSGESQAK